MSDPKWGGSHQSPLVQEYHDHVRALTARRADDLGVPWSVLVAERPFELLSAADLEALEKSKLDTGYLFDAAATVSVKESPDKYKPIAAAEETGAAEVLAAGDRIEVAAGDNVRQMADVSGTVRHIRTTEQVFELLAGGVPERTVALIDDSGGTLTAPILQDFAAVLCLGGTVRSHLSILAREYGLPCLMNVQIGGSLRDGDRVEIEYSAATMTVDAIESGTAARARVWKLG